ncbi:hypothetical protein FQR65_LT19509 [Abscondita terminalis]|nr:hypothetical protein FQR65_LT19509 [Abscondita terminalis]
MKKIAFDVMGSDNGSKPAVEAAVKTLKKYKDLELILVGDENEIKVNLLKFKYDKERVKIKHTTEFIEMNGSIMDIRRKKDSSMVRAIEMLKNQEIDATVTAGATAAFIAGCHFILGELEGIDRPAFMPVIPTLVKDKVTLLLDVGANSENSPKDLFNFAKMATIYSQSIRKIEKPSVGLLNIGEEPSKGNELQIETHKLLTESNEINFYGNIESREIPNGYVDVIVTDGYSGNIALKAVEGMGKALLSEIKVNIKKRFIRILGYLLAKGAFKEVRKKFDYKNHAGAILIGVNGDSILNFLVSKSLFEIYKNENEGFLTKMRSMLVREKSLAYVARSIELGKLIRFGLGEVHDKGHDKDSILADVYESLLTAIYLDQNIQTVHDFLVKTLINEEVINILENENRNFKSELQEMIQADNRSDLIYISEQISKDNDMVKEFSSTVSVEGDKLGSGIGATKKEAEQMAAKSALSKLYTK